MNNFKDFTIRKKNEFLIRYKKLNKDGKITLGILGMGGTFITTVANEWLKLQLSQKQFNDPTTNMTWKLKRPLTDNDKIVLELAIKNNEIISEKLKELKLI